MTIKQKCAAYLSSEPTRLQIPVEPTHDPVAAATWTGFWYGVGAVLFVLVAVNWI